MSEFPSCFPKNFESEILPPEAKHEDKNVYRVIKNGEINRDSFISTFEEIKRGLRNEPKKGINLKDPGTYSTSCFENREDVQYVLDICMKNKKKDKPRAFIAKGVTEKHCGPSQATRERKMDKKDSHVDWWIYEDSSPDLYFKEDK